MLMTSAAPFVVKYSSMSSTVLKCPFVEVSVIESRYEEWIYVKTKRFRFPPVGKVTVPKNLAPTFSQTRREATLETSQKINIRKSEGSSFLSS